jgi:hypothetical protein
MFFKPAKQALSNLVVKNKLRIRITALDWLTARFAKANHAKIAKEILRITINSF